MWDVGFEGFVVFGWGCDDLFVFVTFTSNLRICRFERIVDFD